jgi:hypothetical protein
MKHAFSLGLTALVALSLAAEAGAQPGRAPSSMLRYNSAAETAGDGYLTGADLWNTLKPANTTEATRLGSPFANVAGGVVNRMLFGSRGNWQEPGGHWPAGYRYTNTFRNSHFVVFPVFKATGWPGYGTGNPVRAADPSTDNRGTGGTSRFMWAAYGPNVVGANNPARNYKRPARFTDASRTHLIYEAGWPTTAGIDFKVRVHQYTPNEQNLNDFTVMEVTLTNTGVVDSNADGTPEATGNVVDGVSMMLDATPSPTIQTDLSGDRTCNCIAAGRTFGYVASPDATGAPYNLFAWYANVPTTATVGRANPPPGQRSFGIDNRNQLLGYSDIWNSWTFLGVKQGSISDANLSAIRSSTADKQTVFGTHPVGEGSRRGWYISQQWRSSLSSLSNSMLAFRNATATWYADYGKTSDGSSVPANLAPNPAFFSAGTADDITTFRVGNAAARPNGDFKYASEDISKAAGITQPIWEPAWNPQATSGNFYDGGVGFTREYTFGEAIQQSAGPFSLAVGESITFVWTALAGFRMEGVVDAARAARWAWDRGWQVGGDLPVPAAPEMNVESTTAGTAMLRWTDVANVRPISGYKIWRASQYKRTKYLDKGMRLVDRYHEQHSVGEPAQNLYDPVNPLFDAQALFVSEVQGSYQPGEWGTYDLIAKIPVGSLGQYANASGGYQYAYEDKDAITGFTYWYYISAYRDGNVTGPLGRTVGHLESGRINWNGRNGRSTTPGGTTPTPNATVSLDSPWGGTYPWATANALYPRTTTPEGRQALKNIGAPFTVTPPVAAVADVARLITVTPNPYKITGLNDVRSDPASHSIDFLNLPANYTLTIMDVSGQIVFQQKVENAVNGKLTWDMFSKDGVEVASGLYVYHVAYDGGTYTGYFSILR